jgi:hypothetical protein
VRALRNRCAGLLGFEHDRILLGVGEAARQPRSGRRWCSLLADAAKWVTGSAFRRGIGRFKPPIEFPPATLAYRGRQRSFTKDLALSYLSTPQHLP